MKTLTVALSIIAALGLSACSTPAPAPAPSISASAPIDTNIPYEGSSSFSGIGEIPAPKKSEAPTPKKKEAPKKKAEERQTYLVEIINGRPNVVMPDLPAPTKLKSVVFRPGTGEVIDIDTTMVLHETRYDWKTGEVTDTSYPSNPGSHDFDGIPKETSDVFVGQRVGALIGVEVPAKGDRKAYLWVVEIVGTKDREPVKTTAKTAGKALSEPDHVAKVAGDVTPQIEKTTPLLKAEKTSVTLVGETDAEPSPVTTVPIEPEAPVNGPLLPPRITVGTNYGSITIDAEKSGPVFVSWNGSTTDQEAFTVVCPPELRGADFIGCVQSDGSKWQWMPAADVSTWALQTFGGGNRV